MPRLYKILVEEKLVRSRTEAERLIRQGAVSVGGCDPTCTFFETESVLAADGGRSQKRPRKLRLGWPLK